MNNFARAGAGIFGAAVLVAASATPARADDAALDLGVEAVADVTAQVAGAGRGTDFTGIVRVHGDLDLERAAGWSGASIHVQAIASAGTRPNDRTGTLQGVDNIEVSENRMKLFEVYLDQHLGPGDTSLRVGFADLNADFYATDCSGLLIAPAFGIGSELSATGPNGPSLFPSTALTARLHLDAGKGYYANFAVVNAEAGVLGDTLGVRPLFGQGALLIGEAGRSGAGKLALGGWTYTRSQDDLRSLDLQGNPARRTAFGGYLLVDVPLGPKAGAFARLGFSDGTTTPYWGGWQAGVIVQSPLAVRPNGVLSFGVNQAFISGRHRANMADAGTPLGRRETGVELTYSDDLLPGVRIQPDLQWIAKADRSPGPHHAVVAVLRLSISY